ncbi:ETS-related transcription factor Elf-4 isoform X1 [Lates japonicus]|uniref:ETS-related transcription factor Elf-4 isoform X1 n=1 Tax=Lates japonicus TaxID=270547 RepID=A0AAD3NEW4_LATJO|nr:ETS-related transcription factor Elf-4 isoform X1 [Lates japonicus]
MRIRPGANAATCNWGGPVWEVYGPRRVQGRRVYVNNTKTITAPTSVPMVRHLLAFSPFLTTVLGQPGPSHPPRPRVTPPHLPSTTAVGQRCHHPNSLTSSGASSLQDLPPTAAPGHCLASGLLPLPPPPPALHPPGHSSTAQPNGLPRLVAINTTHGQTMAAQQPGTAIATCAQIQPSQGCRSKRNVDLSYFQSMVNAIHHW